MERKGWEIKMAGKMNGKGKGKSRWPGKLMEKERGNQDGEENEWKRKAKIKIAGKMNGKKKGNQDG